MRGEYIAGCENVLLVGNSGTGKTHLACALAFAACALGRRVRFLSVTGLVTRLLEQREERSLERLHRQLERQDLLVLDELGYVPFTKPGAELLFEVVSRAYERTSLMVTTNLPFEQWTEVLGSERLTGALLDRLTHRVHIVEANGESYRLRESKRRQRGRPSRGARGGCRGVDARRVAGYSRGSVPQYLPAPAALLDRPIQCEPGCGGAR